MKRLKDPRVWLGLAVTAVCLWLALRGVDFREMAGDMAKANWFLLLGVSIPAHILALYLRALRWRHLTDAVQPIGTGPLFRAVSVGFMTNNVLPLRVGEVVRTWYLARETGGSAASLFGTVILERVLDAIMVVALVFGVLAMLGIGREDAIARVAMVGLLPAALAPLAFVVGLRLAPERVIATVHVVLRPFPDRFAETAEGLLRRVGEGLGALSGGSHLFWIGFHTLTIWLVASTLPLLIGFWSLDMQFGSPWRELLAAWTTLGAVGVSVAIPSAPGFFGPYHAACKFALERFGVPADTAVALGTLVHGVFWLTLTALGLLVLRLRRTSLGEIDEATGRGEPSLE